MVEQLFGSKTRVKLLQLFLSNPNRSFYVREITRKIDEQINSVRRELANLLSIGIISSDNNNNKLYYEVNQKYEHYHALSSIFGKGSATQIANDEGVSSEGDDVAELKKTGNIEAVVLTGQFTRDESSGIDMLVIGDVNQSKLSRYISQLEKKEGKDIRYAVFLPSEFEYRQQINDRFLTNLLVSKKQILIDKKSRFSKKGS